ncbi:MAG TPA: hypothetical protein P5531_08800 [Bacteroidales bacterium]|nr:hypothetical protein [Bacteroidales bacterium]HSA43813.1 hypothetical protein [Bacteroidales bacterium]
MRLLISFLLAIPAVTLAYHPDSLKMITQQADYVALVEMDSRPMDSIFSLIEDLGTEYYFPRFKVIRVFKADATLPDSSFSMVLSNVNPQFQSWYIPGERYYLFLSLGLPKHPDLSDLLMPYGKSNGMPVLLAGGLILQTAVADREIRKLTRPSNLAKAAMQGNCKKMLRILRRHDASIKTTKRLYRKQAGTAASPSLPDWLQKQQGIAGVMTDTCSMHIAIWPGWSDYFFWVNRPEGMKEYHICVQHGRSYGCCCLRWTSERSFIKSVAEAPGAREQIIRLCEQTALNESRDRYNNLVQLRLDEGRLHWSVVNAPLHLDSDGELIRLKVSLTNHGDSALFVRWPGLQNHGRKIIRFSLHHQESRRVFHESPFLNLPHDETLGPEEILLEAGGSVSAWHSLNDRVFLDRDARTDHHFDSLPPGTYSVQACYQPYPDSLEEYPCWEPWVDSITAWTGYPFHLSEDPAHEAVKIRCRVVETAQNVMNGYEQPAYIHGIVEVLENPSLKPPAPGSLIAWKILIPGPAPAAPFGRPPYMHEIVRPGDMIWIRLSAPAYPGQVTTASGKYPLFVTDRDVSLY